VNNWGEIWTPGENFGGKFLPVFKKKRGEEREENVYLKKHMT